MQRNLIAILRGVKPDEIEGLAQVLIASGINIIEIPLNSPDPITSLARVTSTFAGQGIFGAGTVLTASEVERVAAVGGQLIVSPNCDPAVITATKRAGMQSLPGVMTPTESLQALAVGADGLKFFPGEVITPDGLAAIRAVLPASTRCFPVGGVGSANFASWKTAGATGFGIGSALYQAGDGCDVLAAKAKQTVKAYDAVMGCGDGMQR